MQLRGNQRDGDVNRQCGAIGGKTDNMAFDWAWFFSYAMVTQQLNRTEKMNGKVSMDERILKHSAVTSGTEISRDS